MERTHDPLSRVSMRPVFDLNEVPPDPVETTDVTDRQKAPLYVRLSFHNEDMEVVKRKYKVLGSSEANDNAYFKNLGFDKGVNTLMYKRYKRVKYQGKPLQDLARLWFKTDVTEREKPQELETIVLFPEPTCDLMAEGRMAGDKCKEKGNEYDAETIAATELFREFVKKANNDQACRTRKEEEGKGKEKVQEHVSFTSWPPHGKKKRKMQSFNGKLRIN